MFPLENKRKMRKTLVVLDFLHVEAGQPAFGGHEPRKAKYVRLPIFNVQLKNTKLMLIMTCFTKGWMDNQKYTLKISANMDVIKFL